MKRHLLCLVFFAGAMAFTSQSIAQDGYSLVWSEEFNGTELNTDVWNIEVNGDGGGNNELQYYCEKAVSVQDGCLVLTATKEEYNGRHCTSGRVNTKQKMYYTYGKIEARIKFPDTANGLWPAFWQMGNNYPEVGWPRCGEIDLIELGHQNAFSKGTQDRYFNGAMHLGSAWNSVWSDAQTVTWPYSVEDTFHIVTMIWTPTSIDMYMDKDAHPDLQPYFHANLEGNDNPDYNRYLVFGKPNFIIANLAVGGNFPGIKEINKITALANGPRSMYIDWIRIYQKGESGETLVAAGPTSVNNISTKPDVIKVMENGNIRIVRNGRTYSVTGQLIR